MNFKKFMENAAWKFAELVHSFTGCPENNLMPMTNYYVCSQCGAMYDKRKRRM